MASFAPRTQHARAFLAGSRCEEFCTAAPSRFLQASSTIYELLACRKLGHESSCAARGTAKTPSPARSPCLPDRPCLGALCAAAPSRFLHPISTSHVLIECRSSGRGSASLARSIPETPIPACVRCMPWGGRFWSKMHEHGPMSMHAHDL